MNTVKKTLVAVAAITTLAATALTSTQASAWGHGGFGIRIYAAPVFYSAPTVVYTAPTVHSAPTVYGSGGYVSVGFGRGHRRW